MRSLANTASLQVLLNHPTATSSKPESCYPAFKASAQSQTVQLKAATTNPSRTRLCLQARQSVGSFFPQVTSLKLPIMP